MDFLSRDALRAGTAVKRYGSDFSDAFRGQVAGSQRNDIAGMGQQVQRAFSGSMGMGLPGATPRAFEVGFNQEGANPFAPAMQESEETMNPVITMFGTRFVGLGAQNLSGADLGPPSERQLAIGRRDRIVVNDTATALVSGSNDQLMASMFGGHTGMSENEYGVTTQSGPTLAMNPIQNNYLLAQIYNVWADYPGIKHMTEKLLWNGRSMMTKEMYPTTWKTTTELDALPDFPTWEGLSWLGTVRNIITEDGNAAQWNDGITVTRGHMAGSADQRYVATVICRGKETTIDYWEGKGVHQGRQAYAVLKKWKEEEYRHPTPSEKGILMYDMMTKGHDQFRDGAAMKRGIERKKLPNGVLVRPPQWGFITCDGPLDRDYARYVDEWGREREGLIVKIGTIHTAAIRTNHKPAPTVDEFRPFMDNRGAMRNDPLELVININEQNTN